MPRKWTTWLAEDRAQDAFEYMMVVGAVVVAAVITFQGIGGVIGKMASNTCPAVDPLGTEAGVECVVTATPSP
jgi:hypothetical protein